MTSNIHVLVAQFQMEVEKYTRARGDQVDPSSKEKILAERALMIEIDKLEEKGRNEGLRVAEACIEAVQKRGGKFNYTPGPEEYIEEIRGERSDL